MEQANIAAAPTAEATANTLLSTSGTQVNTKRKDTRTVFKGVDANADYEIGQAQQR
jgi:hypothetical protein